MSFKEVKELRQSGKLEEALALANTALSSDPEDLWNKRAIAWVHYDYLKKYAQPDDYDHFIKHLQNIVELDLPSDEHMVFDNCAWQIGKLVFGLTKAEKIDFQKVNDLFSMIKSFSFTIPSEQYTFIYKAFHKGYREWSKYVEFADWWDFSNFRSQDYLKEEFDGKQIMSIAEQAFIAYSKKLLEGEVVDPFGRHREVNKAKIQEFLPTLDTIIDEHPEYQYPPYFKAKLLLAIGSEDNVLSAFLPFAKQKRNEFWVWELMAEIFASDNDMKLACYCKALSVRAREDFLVKVREELATLLIELQMYTEAKTEIDKLISARTSAGWKVPAHIQAYTSQDWYTSTDRL